MATYKPQRRPIFRIRPAEARDIVSLLELETSCFARTEEMFNRRQLQRLIANPRAVVVVAERKDRVLGWAAGLVRLRLKSYSGRVYAVAVHPDAQGKRVGYKLTSHVLHALTAYGAQRIFLEVHAENQKAINLYRMLGFIDQGYLANYYGPHHNGIRMMRSATMTQRPKR
ncbi:MAG: GNAT family N-acetyltransferase [Planctomycetia bacterium]|nr:GNAT family N-acetyltransferase [Planctomycetia bacterium]